MKIDDQVLAAFLTGDGGQAVGNLILPWSSIDPDPNNPRSEDSCRSHVDWPQFVDSLRRHGVLEPVLVTPPNAVGRYQLIRGHRRRLGCLAADIPSTPARIADSAAEAVKPMALFLDNHHRAALDPFEEAEYFAREMARHGWSQADLCRNASLRKSYVSARLKLLEIPKDQLAELRLKGPIKVKAAEELSRKVSAETGSMENQGGKIDPASNGGSGHADENVDHLRRAEALAGAWLMAQTNNKRHPQDLRTAFGLLSIQRK